MEPGGSPPSPSFSPSVDCALALVKMRIHNAGVDGSHDYLHILRVVGLADRLARAEDFDATLHETTLLAAALHDVHDTKYTTKEEGLRALREILDSLVEKGHVATERASRIEAIVLRVGFKESLAGGTSGAEHLDHPEVLAVVNDADQLDAIGAIGIARCFTFGGARNRPLYDPATIASAGAKDMAVLPFSKDAYEQKRAQGSATVDHFHEKLLHLRDRMRTQEGKRIAQGRHDFMLAFLRQLRDEVGQRA